jgi:hypothetical protein
MLAALRRRIYEVLTNGNLEARKGCCRRWWLRPWARAANKLRPLFKVPALTSAVGFQRGSRDGRFVAPTYQHANRLLVAEGPPVRL